MVTSYNKVNDSKEFEREFIVDSKIGIRRITCKREFTCGVGMVGREKMLSWVEFFYRLLLIVDAF